MTASAAALAVHEVLAVLRSSRTVDAVVGRGASARWPRLPLLVTSSEPATVLLCGRRSSGLGAAAEAAGSFGVEVSERSGAPPWSALAATCVLLERTETAGLDILVGRVVEGRTPHGSRAISSGPLTDLGPAGAGTDAARDEAHHRARELLLLRHYLPDTIVEPADLAHDLQADLATATSAITQLRADGLVRRDPVRGHVVVPLDVQHSDETFDARCVIELGVLETALHHVSDDQVAGLGAAYERMARELVAHRFVDFGRYLAANVAFHERVVMLAGSAPLRAAFGQLGIKEVMTRSFGWTSASSQSFLEAQHDMLVGIEARDLAAARAATLAYRDLAKQRVRDILSQTGGRL